MTWTLAPALKQLMNEVNAAWPNRSREWDGTIGDYLHSLTTSEHNPYDEYGKKDPDGVVRAVDITAQGIDVPTLLGAAIGDPRVHYVIYRGRICSRTYRWTWRPSKGHEHHVHISLRNNTSERCDPATVLAAQKNTRPWFTGAAGRTETDIPWEEPMNQETKNELAAIRDGILATHLPGCGTLKEAIIDTTIRVRELSQDLADVRRGAPEGNVPVNQEIADAKTGIRALTAKVDALEGKLDAILKALGNANAR